MNNEYNFKIECPKCKSIECGIESSTHVLANQITERYYQTETHNCFKIFCRNCAYATQTDTPNTSYSQTKDNCMEERWYIKWFKTISLRRKL